MSRGPFVVALGREAALLSLLKVLSDSCEVGTVTNDTSTRVFSRTYVWPFVKTYSAHDLAPEYSVIDP